MNFNDYYNVRSKITEIMEKDFLGPLIDDEIICDERPLDYYIIGKLYPQRKISTDSMRNLDDELAKMATDDVGELDEEDNISLCNGYNPSSFGISFSVNPGINCFTIVSKAAIYSLIERKDAQEELRFSDTAYKKNAKFWKRNSLVIPDIDVKIEELIKGKTKKISIDKNLSIDILFHKEYSDGIKTITVSMINHTIVDPDSRESYIEESISSFFQPEIKIIPSNKDSFGDIRRNIHLSEDPEIRELNMLYNRVSDYASGHGCAVDWECDKDGHVLFLRTKFLPLYSLKQMMSTEKYKDSSFLRMKYLASDDARKIIDELKILVHDYSQWILKQRETVFNFADVSLKETAERNLNRCASMADLLLKSIELLNDKTVFKAFSYANQAMFDQRKKVLSNTGIDIDDDKIAWYPFQLAFILKEIYSIVKEKSEERNTVDLLWFPTGGGKTEAYLGIAAFTIFYRRLAYGADGDGVTVLMRYTLRLLSFQQFERAAALICACEIIRRNEKLDGGEIGIGLWVGRALTPNKIDEAKKILERESEPDDEIGNPVQFRKCPWCGSELNEDNYHCDTDKKRMLIKCGNTLCEFKSGLPIFLIDEEIYKYKPSFIIGTIDKFAQLALNEQTVNIFGIGPLRKKPPELIIQDELHLISGPLGTITGLYEVAIRKLCEYNGVFPKIIASTATIRNAKEQIKHLYSSGFTQFPPQGIDINDSFFAVISNETQRPSRLYLGCMAIGTSPTTMMIRVMAALLFATRYLAYQGYDEKVIDSFWTITIYFNTLRELGGAIIRVVDDIQDRFEYLKKTKFSRLYSLTDGPQRFDYYKELTSREKSENIGNVIQNELKIPFKNDGSTRPYDFLLCSNMISVGLDIGRLGTMIVVGQPKTSSEYIQSTSRVGRETPGLVIATYNQSKSRDRSHYEKFTQYHGSFYKFVEATSLTPFSVRARDRALQALYVILCRYLIPKLKGDSDAVNFNRNIAELKIVKDYIINYVKNVDPGECDDLIRDLSEIEDEWERKASKRSNKLKYRRTKYTKADETLFEPEYNEDSRFRVLNSMRSVETTVNVIVKEKD